MNKSEYCTEPGGVSKAAGCSRKRRRARDLSGVRTPVSPGVAGHGGITAEAERLLAALAQAGAEGLRDPEDPDAVIVRKVHKGVSVGAGRFSGASAENLTRHELAQWTRGGGAPLLRITKAGEARQRRRAAGEDQPFLQQHRPTTDVTIVGDDGPQRVRVDAEESPLDWLRRRKGTDGRPLIDEACYEAGERLRRDITSAGMLPGVTARWDEPKGSGPSGPAEATDRMVAARQRIRHAFDALGADFSDLLIDLCGFLKGIEVIERERQWPARSAKVVIRLALSRLAEHYGLETAARGPQASRGIRTWRAVVIEGGLG